MHYGLTNVPASFQHFMDDVFTDLLDVSVVVYLDHTLIYSEYTCSYSAHSRLIRCPASTQDRSVSIILYVERFYFNGST